MIKSRRMVNNGWAEVKAGCLATSPFLAHWNNL
jgi:hypothetical protein